MRIEFPVYVSSETARLASLWHGGQWSALYSLSSTGRVSSREHYYCICAEIRAAERGVERHPYLNSYKSDRWFLRRLKKFLNLDVMAHEDKPDRQFYSKPR